MVEAKVLYAFLSLIERGAATFKALKGAAEVMKAKADKGEEVTIDDLREYWLADDASRKALQEAIDEAERREQG